MLSLGKIKLKKSLGLCFGWFVLGVTAFAVVWGCVVG